MVILNMEASLNRAEKRMEQDLTELRPDIKKCTVPVEISVTQFV